MSSRHILKGILAFSLFAGVSGTADARRHDRDHHDKTGGTILGIGIGLLGGALLSDGDPWATLAGAAAGGAIGNATASSHDRHHRDDRPPSRDWQRRPGDSRRY